jgi:small subunit ribosomal protein S21
MVILPSNTLIKVQVRSNESLDAALRRFKRQCNQAGVFIMMKERSFFTKPTWARTEAKEERRRVVKRAARIRRNARF